MLVAQLYPILCDPMDCRSALQVSQSWDSPGKNTRVGCHSLLQGIFLTKGSNAGLLHRQADSLHLSYQGSRRGGQKGIRIMSVLLIFFLWDPKFPGPATYFIKHQIIAAIMLTWTASETSCQSRKACMPPKYYYLKENGRGTQTFRKH